MSTNPPTPGQHDPSRGRPWPTEPFGQPSYEQPPAPRRRGKAIAVITAVLVLLVGGGAFAFYQTDPLHLFTAGPQAAEALPADALLYIGVDADPSARQKVDAVRFLNHFPYFKEHSGLSDESSDIREGVFQKFLDAAGCSGVSYDDTLKPWLGKKFGFALMPADDPDTSPVPVLAVEITDETTAKSGLADLASCSEQLGGEGFGYAFEGDYVLVAQSQEVANQYSGDAESYSLADSDDFNNDMDSLGYLGVATMWVNVQDVADAYGDTVTANAITPPEGFGALTNTYQRVAATFRFGSDHVEVATSVFGDTTEISHGDNRIVDLPESTVFAMSESGGAERLKASWDNLKGAASSDGADVDQEIADFEAQTGFALPDDLETVLGDNFLVALDSEGLTADTLQAGDPSLLNLGVVMTSDPDQLNALYEKITSLIQDQGGQEDLAVSKVDTGDGMAIATNDSYADTLAGLDGTLGESDVFRSVVPDAASKEFVVFFNWDAVEGEVTDALRNDSGSAQTQDIIDNLVPLRALGASTETDGDYTVSTLTVSVND